MNSNELVNQWRRGMRISHASHYESAKYYYRMHLIVSLPAVIVSALLSTAVFASLKNSNEVWIQYCMAALSVVTVVLSSLQAALKFSERSERHRTAAVQTGEVRRLLEQQMLSTQLSESELSKIREQWDAVDRQAPNIPSSIYKRELDRIFKLGDSPTTSTQH